LLFGVVLFETCLPATLISSEDVNMILKHLKSPEVQQVIHKSKGSFTKKL
jgi:hypothetical protein